MTKLEEILAEEWTIDQGVVIRDEVAPVGAFDRLALPYCAADVYDRTRASVAVLGKRALAVMLDLERNGIGCPDCPKMPDDPVHTDGCRWGRIVAAAKEIG
jgi:hypothetical protein